MPPPPPTQVPIQKQQEFIIGPKEELELLKFALNCTKGGLLDEVERLVMTVCELVPEGDRFFVQQLFKRYFD